MHKSLKGIWCCPSKIQSRPRDCKRRVWVYKPLGNWEGWLNTL